MRREAVAILSLMTLGGVMPVLGWATLRVPAGPASQTIVITHGGTYSGTWESKNARVPAVAIQTAEPVMIENSTIRGRGVLIHAAVPHVQLTVRNSHGTGMNPNVRGLSPGRFLTAESFDSIRVENCQLDHTSGIYLLSYGGDFAPAHTIRIVGNVAHDIDGRKSNGTGGLSHQAAIVQFLQLDQVRHLGGVEIAWNQVINDPGQSAVEDNISIYKSSGTAQSPIRIHDNFIDGAYPANPRAKNYSGGGIMLGDGSADTLDAACGYVEAYSNVILNTTNYGIAISAGHDIVFHDNRILSTGRLPDGSPLPAQNVGAYIWDTNHDSRRSPPTFFNNSGHDNLIGWRKGPGRNDWWTPDAGSWTNNSHWEGSLTAAILTGEKNQWEKRASDAGVTVGVRER